MYKTAKITYYIENLEKKIQTHPYLVRRDAAHHVVRAIQGVGQGVFVRCLVQLLNNTCRRKHF